VAADLEFCSKSFVFAFCVVKDVDTQFSCHVKAIVRADVDAHLTCCARFPNHTNSAIVVSWNEEPRLHFLKSFVRVLNSLRFPKRWEQVGSDSVGCELLIADVVEFRGLPCAGLVTIAEEFGVLSVVVPHGQALSKDLTKKWEGSERRDQCNFERVPE
jgi:hypothetical protein